jgi:hypothetical protein
MSRTLTDQQFAEGTTIDGNRIDEALADAVDRTNQIPHGDLETRWTQTQFVFGYLPDPGTLPLQYPWQSAAKTISQTAPPHPDSYANKAWVKGIYGESPAYIWTLAMKLVSPVIICDLAVFFHTDSVYSNTFLNAGTPVDDIHVLVTVDDPFAAEDRRQNAVIFARHSFAATAEWVTNQSTTPAQDMQIVHPYGLDGMMISGHDLNVPIHHNARVRLQIVLPTGGYYPWSDIPYHDQYYSGTLTLLEEVQPK